MEKKGIFHDVRVHIICLILVVIAELIGIIPVKLGKISFSLLPMLFALVIGIIVSVVGYNKVINDEEMADASKYVGISVMTLIAFMASPIGPNLPAIVRAGPALILQEFGNLGTIFFSMPVAILILKMDRTAIGSAFSNSREPSLAIVGTIYGLDGPEGRGVMGSYITGTLLGTIFCGILAGLLINVSWFSPESLAMAAGTGSASMMSAAIAPVVEAFPEKADALQGYASASQVLTTADGMYMSIFIGLPLTEWLYRKLKGKDAEESESAKKLKSKDVKVLEQQSSGSSPWSTRIKVLIIAGIFAIIGMTIESWKNNKGYTPIDFVPGMIWLFGIIIVGSFIGDKVNKAGINLPTVLFVALVSTILSVPNLWPGAEIMLKHLEPISLLPLCTPILAYAGLSTGKDVAAFKQQGAKIIIVTLLAFTGTYLGSAIIANIVLNVTGAI